MDEKNTKFGYQQYKTTLRSLIKFELKSFFGRMFSPKIRKNRYRFINIGCGNQIHEGFENLDFYALRFWKSKHIGHDLRYRLPYKDLSFEGAFCDNVLEHLHPSDAINFLKDVKRILKKDGIFRIIVPDLEKYVSYYKNRSPEEFNFFGNGCNAIWNLTHNWGHLSVWDYEMMNLQLSKIGFKNIKQCEPLNGSNKKLILDFPGREWECLYIECTA